MEKDWKLFKKKLGGWQESYMDRLIEAYKDILNSDALSSDKHQDFYNPHKFSFVEPSIYQKIMHLNLKWICIPQRAYPYRLLASYLVSF